MTRLLVALALLVSMEVTVNANERECRFRRVEPDGTLDVDMDGAQQRVQIFGIVVPQPPSSLYMDIVGKRIHGRHKPLRCDIRAVGPGGLVRGRIWYYAWQDKSGDVWDDLALTLLDQGVARVSDEKFPERDEYLRHQRP